MASAEVPSRPLPSGGPTAGAIDWDNDIDNYEIDGENDPFAENYKNPAAMKQAGAGSKGYSGSGLGIDEEIEVTRKPRVPRAKLDEHRYMS